MLGPDSLCRMWLISAQKGSSPLFCTLSKWILKWFIAGRWRNTLVAIKKVEHSVDLTPGMGVGAKSFEEGLQLETLLSLSLSHPNIVVTFRVCTMESGTLVPSASDAASATSSNGAPPATGQRAAPAAPAAPALPPVAEVPAGPGGAARDGPAGGAADMAAATALAGSCESGGVSSTAAAPVTEEAAAAGTTETLAEPANAGRAASEPVLPFGQPMLPFGQPSISTAPPCSTSGPLPKQLSRKISLPRRLDWDADHGAANTPGQGPNTIENLPAGSVPAVLTGQESTAGPTSSRQRGALKLPTHNSTSSSCCSCFRFSFSAKAAALPTASVQLDAEVDGRPQDKWQSDEEVRWDLA